MHCVHCSQEVSALATVCPFCRSDPCGGPNPFDAAYQKAQLKIQQERLQLEREKLQAQAQAQAEQQRNVLTWHKAENGFWFPVRDGQYVPGYQWRRSDNPNIYYLYKGEVLKGAWDITTNQFWKQELVMEYVPGQLLVQPVEKWVEAKRPWWRQEEAAV